MEILVAILFLVFVPYFIGYKFLDKYKWDFQKPDTFLSKVKIYVVGFSLSITIVSFLIFLVNRFL